ncbi:MAG: hypothetical protein KDA41_16795, partial [Planctomycetales bacterium]|nr:hypothetical protein [Planctomycetales bacterium]
MSTAQRFRILCVALAASSAAALSIGCGGAPARVELPSLDPSGAAQAAMQQFDANSDGALDKDELQKAPGLVDNPAMPVKLIDADSDGKVTAAEIQARVQKWIDDKVGVMTLPITVKLDGKPLEGATV